MTTDDTTPDRAEETLASRDASEECWTSLPPVLRTLFECSRGLSAHDALRALGVADPSEIVIERVYELDRGSLIVTVWHDQIERDADGTIVCWIDSFGWRPEGEGAPGDRNADTRRLLSKHAGRDVYALLMKRSWNDVGAPFVECTAPDIVMWTLAAAGQEWFVLRRPTVQRSDPKRGAPGSRN